MGRENLDYRIRPEDVIRCAEEQHNPSPDVCACTADNLAASNAALRLFAEALASEYMDEATDGYNTTDVRAEVESLLNRLWSEAKQKAGGR